MIGGYCVLAVVPQCPIAHGDHAIIADLQSAFNTYLGMR